MAIAARLIACRQAVYDQIVADASGYAITDLNIEETYLPQETLASLTEKPAIKVIGKGFDQERILRSGSKTKLLLPVEVAVQKKVDLALSTLTAVIDDLILLTQQVMASLASDTLSTDYNFTWSGTEAMKDENDLPYSYDQLRQESIFQAIFTVNYSHIKQ